MYMIPEQEIMRLIDMYPCQYDKEDLVAAACKATNQKGKDIYVVVDNRTGDCWTEEFLTEVGCRLYLDVELDVETCHALDFKAYIEQRRILRRERKWEG